MYIFLDVCAVLYRRAGECAVLYRRAGECAVLYRQAGECAVLYRQAGECGEYPRKLKNLKCIVSTVILKLRYIQYSTLYTVHIL